MTHQQDFIQWLYEEGKDEKTIKAYKTSTTQFITWLNQTTGKEAVSDVKPIDIKEFISYLKHRLNRSQATINKSIAALKTFFNYLSEQGLINDNPMTRIKIQKVQQSEQAKGVSKWLTKTEQDRFISYVELEKNEFKRLRNLAIIDMMLFCGLRVSEVEDLKLDDIRVNGNIEITIREGKHGKYATVVLVEKHSKNLRKWFKYRKELTYEMYLDSPYLFISERSDKFSSRGIQMMVNKYAKLASMEQVNCHRFRHSFCKNLAVAGINIQTIADLARHESINTTRIYVNNSQEERLLALEKL